MSFKFAQSCSQNWRNIKIQSQPTDPNFISRRGFSRNIGWNLYFFWKQQFIRPVGWAEPGLVLLREPAKAAARELKGDPRGHRRLVSASPPTCVCSLCAYINKTVMCVDFHVLLLLLLQKAWLAQPGLLRREPGELGWIIVGFWGRFKYAFLGAFQEFVPKTTLFD